MFHFFDAHAIISYFPGGYQINCFSFQILQTAHNGGDEVFKVVSGSTLRLNAFYRFGLDKIFFTAFPPQSGQRALAAPIALCIGGIEKVDS